jgi:hypothetical protein
LRKWRKQRNLTKSLISQIEEEIADSYPYKEDKNDSPMLKCSKIVDLAYWKSFNIVVESIDYYGYGSQEN